MAVAYHDYGLSADEDIVIQFQTDINNLPDDEKVTWYNHWTQLQASADDNFIDNCFAIKPITLSTTPCLCELQYSCKDICENQIKRIMYEETHYFVVSYLFFQKKNK